MKRGSRSIPIEGLAVLGEGNRTREGSGARRSAEGAAEKARQAFWQGVYLVSFSQRVRPRGRTARPDQPDSRTATAYHEAGHAVLAHSLGFEVVSVSLGDEPYPTTRHYDLDGRHLLSPVSRGTWSFPAQFGHQPRPQILARIRSVPRRVHLHIFDGIESVSALGAELDEMGERILEARQRKA